MRNIRTVFIAATLNLAFLAPANSAAFCFQEAGARYGIAPELLVGISKQESGMRAGLPPNWNTDGSYDVGIMRINSNWYNWSPHVRELWPYMEDPCTNVMVGAWILSQCIDKYGYNWRAVGCYHSQTPKKRDAYAKRVAEKIFGEQSSAPRAYQQPSSDIIAQSGLQGNIHASSAN